MNDHIAWIATLAYHPSGNFIAVGVCGDGESVEIKKDDTVVDTKKKKHKKKHKKKQEEDDAKKIPISIEKSKPTFPGRDFVYDHDTVLRDKKSKLNGGWFVLDEKTLDIVFRARDSLSSVTCVRYSPDGQVLAVASSDGQIYLYNSQSKDYNVLGRCIGHNGPVTQLDFDRTSQWIHTNSFDQKSDTAEMRWYDCRTGEPNASPSEFKDMIWGDHSGLDYTCVLGWNVQGAHRPDIENIKVTSVAHRDGLEFGVVGESGGKVKIYKWPILPTDVLIGTRQDKLKKKRLSQSGKMGATQAKIAALKNKNSASSSWKNNGPTAAQALMSKVEQMKIPSQSLIGHHGSISNVGILLRDGWSSKETQDAKIRTTIITTGEIDRCCMEWESIPTDTLPIWYGLNKDCTKVNDVGFSDLEIDQVRKRHMRLSSSLNTNISETKELGTCKETSSAAVLKARGWSDSVLWPGKTAPNNGVVREGRRKKRSDNEKKSLGTSNIERVYGFRTVGIKNSVRYIHDEIAALDDDGDNNQKKKKKNQEFHFREPTPENNKKKNIKKRKKSILTINGGMVVRRDSLKPNQIDKQVMGKYHYGPISAIDIMKHWSRGTTVDGSSGSGGGARKTIVVTGDVSTTPTIALWNADTMECIGTTKGQHERKIQLVTLFKSPATRDQTLLASVGGDVNNTILIHTIPNFTILHTLETSRRRIYDLLWYPNPLDVKQEALEDVLFHRNQSLLNAIGTGPLTPDHKNKNKNNTVADVQNKLHINTIGSYSNTTPCLIQLGDEHVVIRAVPSIAVGHHSNETGFQVLDLDEIKTSNRCGVVYGRAICIGTSNGNVLIYDGQRIHSKGSSSSTMTNTRNGMIVGRNDTAHNNCRIHTIARLSNGNRKKGYENISLIATGGENGHFHIFNVHVTRAVHGVVFNCLHLYDLSLGKNLMTPPSYQIIHSIDSSECDSDLTIATSAGIMYTTNLPNVLMKQKKQDLRDDRSDEQKESDLLDQQEKEYKMNKTKNIQETIETKDSKDSKDSKDNSETKTNSETKDNSETSKNSIETNATKKPPMKKKSFLKDEIKEKEKIANQSSINQSKWKKKMETHGSISYEYQIRDIATHPKYETIFASVGDDKYLKIWNTESGECIENIQLQNPGTCVEYSQLGDRIMIGLGPIPGDPNAGKLKSHLELAGAYQIMTSKDYCLRHTGRDTKARIHMARWSLDDTMLAVASEDRRIAVYNSSGDASGEKPSEYKLMYKLLGFESPPTSIDFSIGNEYMRCAAAPSGAILYCRPGGIQKTVGGSIQPDLISEGHYIQVKDVMWSTHTCEYQWSTTGLHRSMEETSNDICCVAVSERVQLMLAMDCNGRLLTTRFPCPEHGKQAVKTSFMTGSLGTLGEPATNSKKQTDDYGCGSGKVWFLRNGYQYLTLGPSECTIVQWSYKEASLDLDQHTQADLFKYTLLKLKEEMSERYRNIKNRPWISSLVYPSGYIKEDHMLTTPTFQKCSRLRRVIGFSTNHILQSKEGRLLYHSAALGISLDVTNNVQLFYYGHCPNEISGMGCGGGNRIVATGERVSKGDACSIHVWSSDTCSSLRILPPFHRTAITLIDVSENGEWICSVGHDNCYTVALWRADGVPHDGKSGSNPWTGENNQKSLFPHVPNWKETGRLVGWTETSTRPVTFCLLLNGRERTNKQCNEEYDCLTGGVGHVTFYYIQGESLIPSKTITTYDLTGLNADPLGE